MDYTKMNLIVPKIFKNSEDYDFRTDVISLCNPYGEIMETITSAAQKAYDDLLLESFNACGINKETLMSNLDKIAIRSWNDNSMNCTETYDDIY